MRTQCKTIVATYENDHVTIYNYTNARLVPFSVQHANMGVMLEDKKK